MESKVDVSKSKSRILYPSKDKKLYVEAFDIDGRIYLSQLSVCECIGHTNPAMFFKNCDPIYAVVDNHINSLISTEEVYNRIKKSKKFGTTKNIIFFYGLFDDYERIKSNSLRKEKESKKMTVVNALHPCNLQNGLHICVLGLIGAGKSSLTHALEKTSLNTIGLYEPASKTNPYLADYYADPKKWAFQIQIFLLSKRYEQQMLAQSLCLTGKNVIQDSSIFSDGVFVEMLKKDGTLDERDADNYFRLFQNMSRNVMYPTAIVYLDTSVDTSLKRIAKRMSEKEGRKCEAGIEPEYLYSLKTELEKTISTLENYTHVLRIKWDDDKTDIELAQTAQQIVKSVEFLRTATPRRSYIGI